MPLTLLAIELCSSFPSRSKEPTKSRCGIMQGSLALVEQRMHRLSLEFVCAVEVQLQSISSQILRVCMHTTMHIHSAARRYRKIRRRARLEIAPAGTCLRSVTLKILLAEVDKDCRKRVHSKAE